MTTATRPPDAPVLQPVELDALAAWVHACKCFGSAELRDAVEELRQVDEAGEAVKAQLLEAGRVNSAREELRKVTARYSEGHASVGAVQVAHAAVRHAEEAERVAADALVAHEARRQAAATTLCARVCAAVKPHAEAARATLAAAVRTALETAERAAQAQEALAEVVAEVGTMFDLPETPWYPGLGRAATKLQLPRSGVRLAEQVIRYDLRGANLPHIGGGGRHRSWVTEVTPLLAQLEGGRGR